MGLLAQQSLLADIFLADALEANRLLNAIRASQSSLDLAFYSLMANSSACRSSELDGFSATLQSPCVQLAVLTKQPAAHMAPECRPLIIVFVWLVKLWEFLQSLILQQTPLGVPGPKQTRLVPASTALLLPHQASLV